MACLHFSSTGASKFPSAEESSSKSHRHDWDKKSALVKKLSSSMRSFFNRLPRLVLFGLAMASISATTLKPLFYGFDFGTSGVRCCLIDSVMSIVHSDSLSWSDICTTGSNINVVESWEIAMDQLLERTPLIHREFVERICVSGTSSSTLIYDMELKSISRQPRMYDFNVLQQNAAEIKGEEAMRAIRLVCPEGSAANAPTSTLAKVISWNFEKPFSASERLAHQADYLIHYITDLPTSAPLKDQFKTDWHNALKLGYDVRRLEYPKWMTNLLLEQGIQLSFVPQVQAPGCRVSVVNPRLKGMGYSEQCEVVAGTTDSIAAFLASGADTTGQAVTSLGSTLVIKLLSERHVEDSKRGIYSHRLGNRWLVGGASNVGCNILRKEGFSDDELVKLSSRIDPSVDSPLKYYPLTKVGERFPKNDPNKEPVLSPKPVKIGNSEVEEVSYRKEYLHGILQGVSAIEKEGYAALEELGASPVAEVFTAGGGSRNDMWTAMRGRMLGVPVRKADNVDAAYGDALLAAEYYRTGYPTQWDLFE